MSAKHWRLMCAAACGLIAAGTAEAAPISVNYYSSYTDTGTGITFSGTPFFSETIDDININFADHTGPVGRPTEANVFGADFKGNISIPSDGTYTFTFGSDDAGYLFIDNTLVAALPGSHGYGTTGFNDVLTQGIHSFEVQYDNNYCCGAQVGLFFQPGVTPVGSVPEPATWATMIAGVGLTGGALRRRARPTGRLRAA